MIRKLLDGWDLGILIVVNRENNIDIKSVFSKIIVFSGFASKSLYL